jgi:hypothetical protein
MNKRVNGFLLVIIIISVILLGSFIVNYYYFDELNSIERNKQI